MGNKIKTTFTEFVNENVNDEWPKELKDKFLKIRDKLDQFVMPDGKLDNKKFEYLFKLYGEDIEMMNEPDPDGDADDYEGFTGSTFKSRVFDYFPYDYFPERDDKSKKLWKNTNDISTVVAGNLIELEDDDAYDELDQRLSEYKD